MVYHSLNSGTNLDLTMLYKIAADIVVIIHFAFIVFVVTGGLWVFFWEKAVLLHLPAVMWGVFIEFTGGICPLTPLENHLRMAGGAQGFSGGFIEKYITSLIYPDGLTQTIQVALGSAVIIINCLIYGFFLYKKRKARRT